MVKWYQVPIYHRFFARHSGLKVAEMGVSGALAASADDFTRDIPGDRDQEEGTTTSWATFLRSAWGGLRRLLALPLNNNNLNGAHDFNDLRHDDYGIYVSTPTRTIGWATKSTLASPTTATTTTTTRKLWRPLWYFNVHRLGRDGLHVGSTSTPSSRWTLGACTTRGRTYEILSTETYILYQYVYYQYFQNLLDSSIEYYQYCWILLETSRSCKICSSGLAAADVDLQHCLAR